jgi:hypothetical protein
VCERKNYVKGRTYFAMFLCTKISPGLHAVITDSGTRESAQPIHRTYIPKKKKASTPAQAPTNQPTKRKEEAVAYLRRLALRKLIKKPRLGSVDVSCPLGVGREQPGENRVLVGHD